jgi:hypothetical protein
MNKVVSFLMVGLFFAVFNVATVAADVPAPTGDDKHTGSGEDCAKLGSPAEVAACWDRKSSHADSNHGGMAPGTTAMCGGVACTTGDDSAGMRQDICNVDCSKNLTAPSVASCVADQTKANCQPN